MLTLTTPLTSLTLLGALKLKGEENWLVQKEVIESLAQSNILRKYIHVKGRAPEYTNEFNNKVNADKLQKWQEQEQGDARIQLAITLNC